jgi:hypothetical protein
MGFPQGAFGSAHLPAVLQFMARFRLGVNGPEQVPPVGAPPAGAPWLNSDRFHLASRAGRRQTQDDPYTLRPLATYAGGQPTTEPTAIMGGIRATNVAPDARVGALANANLAQEYGGGSIYDGKLPMMPLWRAMPYALIPPKLPGMSTSPSAMAASGFVDPYAIAGAQTKGPVGGGLRWTP